MGIFQKSFLTLNLKMKFPDLQRYHRKLCLVKYELDIFKLFILRVLCERDLRIPS